MHTVVLRCKKKVENKIALETADQNFPHVCFRCNCRLMTISTTEIMTVVPGIKR